jgi:hypothetical protein
LGTWPGFAPAFSTTGGRSRNKSQNGPGRRAGDQRWDHPDLEAKDAHPSTERLDDIAAFLAAAVQSATMNTRWRIQPLLGFASNDPPPFAGKQRVCFLPS